MKQAPIPEIPLTNERGFTLLEIMVVVVILGILAGLITQTVFGRVDAARVQAAYTDLKTIESALEMFRLDHRRYPTTDEGLEALVQNPGTLQGYQEGGYLRALKKDPWRNAYLYLQPGQDKPYDLGSHGADGQPGGEGVDADISVWATPAE